MAAKHKKVIAVAADSRHFGVSGNKIDQTRNTVTNLQNIMHISFKTRLKTKMCSVDGCCTCMVIPLADQALYV